MGTRGPVSIKPGVPTAGGGGKRIRRTSDNDDVMFRRIARENPHLNQSDAAMIEQFIMAHNLTKLAYQAILKDGLVETDTTHGNGEEVRKNPNVITFKAASERTAAAAAQLGFSPMARARMPEPEHEQLSLADILFADVPTEVDNG